jgi:fatty acid hydroxylase domain-containing protein 2
MFVNSFYIYAVTYWAFSVYTYSSKRPPELKRVCNVLFNQIIITLPIAQFVELYIYSEYKSVIEVQLEYIQKIIGEIISMIIAAEILFFHMHKLFHCKYLYAKFHYVHHEWTTPQSFASHDSHVIEHIFCNMMPFILPTIFMTNNIISVYTYLFLATLSLVNSHAKEPLVSNIHTLHHKRRDCNYGFLFFCDYLYGSLRT